uniref:Anaphase-promoting complex subunit 4 WD40 domain-containing protein n=1 Tax=Dunaliella tertiolecta TaxID=3047 RepID=A0A7S3VNT5_DUNTE|mmetsp:Transcript_22667/g.62578  ORF Transcript_22667/g.62578 Transcript_22667/m.62578 type:complete len:627 (+) Transcript_22667:275-2155(+)|eukprot:CAMPEP_0202343712 /NCGR_PEP_ID=MMETSP1126-20121109/3706_1 /ASSEMBLY_ACC=CAM_ASM_000457 /TAXON_ID=3047 /ORGANISM="Dunaliella tertiolecta, Strain CCMP1320" /LENGTH=626 /DNA_ID=CAMNT_0048934801 /DNA_START=171 /DNA_END=2051 /DNA_ORIENTATION=-
MDSFWSSGLLLAGAVGNVVSVWNPALGTNQDIQPQEFVNTLQWSANNKVLALGGNNGSVALYSAGHYLGSLPLDTMKPADMDEVTCARFSKDSKLLHTGSNSSCIYTWDLKQQTEMGAFREHKSRITSLAVAQNDEYLASASADGTLLLHTPASNKSLAVLASPDTRAPMKRCLCFSPVEQGLLAAACDDSTVSLWSTKGGRPQQHVIPFRHSDRVTGVALSHTNPSLVFSCGADRNLLALDRRLGTAVQQARLPAPLTSLALCDNELYIAAGASDGSVFVSDVRKLGASISQLHAGQALPVSELHWQSTIRSSRRSSQAHALKPAVPPSSSSVAPSAPLLSSRTSGGASTLPPFQPHAAPTAELPPKPSSTSTSELRTTHQISADRPSSAVTPNGGGTGVHTGGPAGLNPSSTSSTPTTSAAAQQQQQAQVAHAHGAASAGSGGRQSLSGQPAVPPAHRTPDTGIHPSNSGRPSLEPPHAQPNPRLAVDLAGGGSSSGPSHEAEMPTGPRSLGASPSFGATASSPRLKPGGAAGPVASSGPRINMLTEGVFKAYMDDAMASMREDVRNLHIEMLKQFHVQQMEVNMTMLNIANSLQSRQDALGADMRALKQQLDIIMQGQQGQWF